MKTTLRTFVNNMEMMIAVDSVHAHVHAGDYFSGGMYNAAVANAGTGVLLVRNGSKEFHVKFSAAATGDCTVQIFKTPTVSGDGSAVVMSNHNVASTQTCKATVTHTPTTSNNGTQINGTGLLCGGGKHSGSGADFGFGNEFILAPSGVYLLVVTNVSGSTVKMAISVEGYQE